MLSSRWPDISARYQRGGAASGGFRSRHAHRRASLIRRSNSAAFSREIAWRSLNIIARCPGGIGRRPRLPLIQPPSSSTSMRCSIDTRSTFSPSQPKPGGFHLQLRRQPERQRTFPVTMIGRKSGVWPSSSIWSQVRIYDPVPDGLRSAVAYDRTYFDKISPRCCRCWKSSPPGKIAQLLAPKLLPISMSPTDL